jgi:hypothetical protein
VLEEDWTTYPYPEKSLQYGDGPYETKSHIIPNYYKTNSEVIPNYYPTKTQNPANVNFKDAKDKFSYWYVTCVYVCMYTCMYVTCVYMQFFICNEVVCVYICIYMYIIHTYKHTCMYTYTHVLQMSNQPFSYTDRQTDRQTEPNLTRYPRGELDA